MAKKCMIAREKRRINKSERNFEARAEIRAMTKDANAAPEERWKAVIRLQKRKRNESACRVQRRCLSCGRPRAVIRRFRLCRCCLRNAWARGDVPGLVKASW